MTLHKVVDVLKLIIKAGVIFGLSFLLLFFIVRIGIGIKEYFFPTPPPKPTVSFGKLPAVVFPQSVTSKKLDFTIDTLSGTLPSFSDRSTVYKIAAPEQNLLALQRAKEKVNILGFSANPKPLSDSLYKWDSNDKSKTLTLDILKNNFFYTLTSPVRENTYLTSNFQNGQKALEKSQSFISILSEFPKDIDLSKTKITMLAFKNNTLQEAVSIGNTKVVRVDFFQKNVDSLPILYPNPPYSTMYGVISGENSQPQVSESSFFHIAPSSQSATYPIIATNDAFARLKSGKSFIASYNGEKNNIAIKNVRLGYFSSEQNQTFLLPIFEFVGDGGFVAYVTAITDEWTE